jgi:hypothetical protein
MKLEFSRQIFENPQIPNFIKIHSLGAQLFQAGRRAGGQTHDEANSRFSQFCERA